MLVTVSGGIDSVVLVHLLHQLKFDISIAHCNFKLREADSDLDEQFVKKLASDLKLDFYKISFETEVYAKKNKCSIQMAARELRYDWFEEIRQKNNLDYVLTAHHKDDVLETFLINLSRGTGLEGLIGIPSKNGYIVRPMLPFSREDINSFAKENTIEWREDKSNASTKYLRNKIRHDLVPILKELNPSFMSSFENTIDHLKGSQQIVNDAVQEIEKRVVSKKHDYLKLDIEELQKLSNPKIYLYKL
ncbi:MAG: tRNA lysidine(34) synthetase TilS, partial [Flavobacteriaceae bacterium]|nr:tRNA lysidine(34) synthetase TilS [Flavobacteriaceae bacterium]